jgi:hypothetical protein
VDKNHCVSVQLRSHDPVTTEVVVEQVKLRWATLEEWAACKCSGGKVLDDVTAACVACL